MYVCMYVCMYTMILPLHFRVPIYSPWQKKKKNSKNKKRRWALARARIVVVYKVLSIYRFLPGFREFAFFEKCKRFFYNFFWMGVT